jgi:hypothetical protein
MEFRVRCRNGLHEIDPNDPWRGKSGERCRECLLARRRSYNQGDKGREAQRRYNQSDQRRETKRRYNQSDKGREAQRRYNQSDKGREAQRRYNQSDQRREAKRRARQKRIFFGYTYLGSAPTIEQAQEINTYLAQRLADFTSQQRDERKEASDGWRNGTAVA